MIAQLQSATTTTRASVATSASVATGSTVEDYFALEATALEKNDYNNGVITPMVGGTPNHNRIIGNLYAALYFALKNTEYDVFMTDQRLQIPNTNRYTYPDILVTQGDLQLSPGRTDTLTDAVLIAEILSNSTHENDRTQKFAAYQTLPSFQEYLLIDQYQVWVEQYCKQDDRHWRYTRYTDPNETLTFTQIPATLTIADLYDRVQFAPSPS